MPTKCPACGEYKAVKNVAQRLGISKPKKHKKRTRKYAHTVHGNRPGSELCAECRETLSEDNEKEANEEETKERKVIKVEG